MVRFLLLTGLAVWACALRADDGALYRAAVAAASSALQLHDTAGAQRWLDRAPESLRGWEWRYLHGQARRADYVFQPFSWRVSSVAASPDGRLLAVGGPSVVVLFDTASRKQLAENAVPGVVTALSFSPDSSRLAGALGDRTVRLWDLSSWAEVWKVEEPGESVASLAWSPKGTEIAAVSAAARAQAVSRTAGLLTILDAAKGEVRRRLPFLSSPARTVAWSPDGGWIAAGNQLGWLAVWETSVWEKPPLIMMANAEGGVAVPLNSAVFLPDSKRIGAAYEDGRVLEWDVRKPNEPKEIVRYDRPVTALAIHPRGAWLAAVSADATVRLLVVENSGLSGALHHAVSPGTAAAVGPGGSRLYTGHADGTVFEWGQAALDLERAVWRHGPAVLGFEWSPDGKQAATAARGGTLRLWDVATGRNLWEQYAHQFAANAVLFSFDQEKLFSAGEDGRVQGMDLKSATLVMTFEHAPNARAWSMALSPDGLRFVTGSTRPSAKVFDVMTGATRLTIEGKGPGQSGEVWGVDWSLDGSLIALGWTGGGAALVDPGTGAVKVELKGHPAAVHGIAFSPDGKTVATACADGAIRVFNTASGSLVRTLQGHLGAVYGIDFSPDGTRLASASSDQTVRVWEAATGEPLIRLPFSAAAQRVRFSPDGRSLAAALADGRILILN